MINLMSQGVDASGLSVVKPKGICLIRPNVFTGARGGHLCEQLRSDARKRGHGAVGTS